MKRAILILGALALLLGGVEQAKAAIIPFNTGVDASGVSLPDGTIGDPHYSLTTVPSGTTDIRVRTSAGGFPIGPWLGDSTISAWIGPNNDAQVDGAVGDYIYHTTFTLPSAGTLVLTGRWSTDNSGTNILLNGGSTGFTSGGFTTWDSFVISGPGLAGTNTLDFLVNNGGGPTGLRVEFSGAEFVAAVPEPATLTMLGFGIAGLAGYGWRRRKQQVANA